MHQSILIIDDIEDNRELLAIMLEESGYDTVCCEGGKDALKELEQESFDLVLVDYLMPEMDGVETTECIRKMDKYKTMPVIAVTANKTPEVTEQMEKAGANEVLIKPIDQYVLLEVVDRYLGQR